MKNLWNNINLILNKPIFHINEEPITIIGILIFFAILFFASLLSKFLRKLLKSKISDVAHVDRGVNYALQRILHYCILAVGVVIALQFIGIDLGSLAVITGFLSVGIGFGLRNITSNFISGIILLFERPISPGDRVTVAEEYQGNVEKISMRATVINTIDNVSIIVPNSYFIEQDVINWSHGDRKIRIHIPIGVAYGSDTEKVKNCLLKVAQEHPNVMDDPSPNVWFREFGNSSLDFDLIAWIPEPKKILKTKSDLNYVINKIFREEEIEIPFPQHDLHFRSSPGTLKMENNKTM